jgi:hypothetical protein
MRCQTPRSRRQIASRRCRRTSPWADKRVCGESDEVAAAPPCVATAIARWRLRRNRHVRERSRRLLQAQPHALCAIEVGHRARRWSFRCGPDHGGGGALVRGARAVGLRLTSIRPACVQQGKHRQRPPLPEMCARRQGPRAFRLLQHRVSKLKASTAFVGTPISASSNASESTTRGGENT